MSSKVLTRINMIAAVATMSFSVALSAQEMQEANKPRYKLIDLGTLGGPISSFGPFNSVILNEDGTAMGGADTSTSDPNYPNFNPFVAPDPLDPFIQHAFLWQNGVMTDLGALPGTNSSYVNWVNASGVAAGNSENGSIDPLLGWPEVRGVVWKDGQIKDIGTLGGNETSASAINRHGWVVGTTTNAVSDRACGLGTQCRAFLWDEKNGMRDIGTLGTGPDAFAVFVNDLGQVAGISLINTTDPFSHAFLWQNGKMQDIGTLLGGNFSQPNYLNNRGQVVGISTLAGDVVTHPYLWDDGKMTDLGTFGGTFGEATWINDAGEVVGQANHAGDMIHTTFLWKDGVMKDLGVVKGDKCSGAYSMNSKGQIVGSSGLCGISIHGFLWEKGHMIDLNSLIPPGVQLRYGININDRGEIAAVGKIPVGGPDFYNFYDHAFVLIPCDENHRDTAVCKDGDDGAIIQTSPAGHDESSRTLPLSRMRESYRHHN